MSKVKDISLTLDIFNFFFPCADLTEVMGHNVTRSNQIKKIHFQIILLIWKKLEKRTYF